MHTNTEINLGPRLKKQRIDKGFSQAKLSKSIGISPSYLNLADGIEAYDSERYGWTLRRKSI